MNPILEWHSLSAHHGTLNLTIAVHGAEETKNVVLDAKTTHHCYPAKRSVSKGEITLFEITLPIHELVDEDQLELALLNQGKYQSVTYTTSHFFPLCEQLTQAYCILAGICVTRQGNTLRLVRHFKHWKYEWRLCLEFLRTRQKHRMECLLVRLLMALRKGLNVRPLWLLMDRPGRADDNAEAFALYLKEHHPECDVRFVLKRDSSDWARLRKRLRLVPYGSRRHRILSALAQVFISSDAFRPMWHYTHLALRDHFALQPFVFLQHGVINNDMSQWLWKYNQNIAGFVTSWERECQHILAGAYGYRASQVWLTGLPRFDRLYSASKRAFKQITIMPTWRRWLMEGFDAKKGSWTLKAGFEQSDYYQFWNTLLNHPRLQYLAQAYNCKIAFLMHPALASANARLTAPHITFLPAETSYRDVYAQSDCVITDYSSAVFDFGYLEKPILYAQFDQERFFFSGEHSYVKGDFFDAAHDGFGEVVTTLEETLDALAKILAADCQMAPSYQQRVEMFFPYRDCANTARVYEQIIGIL